jgi:hypothetical protein
MNLALNNPYGTINARSFGYPNYNLKPSYSRSNVVFHDEESVRRQTNRDDRQEDSMDRVIDLLSKQAQIKDLTSQRISPYYPQAYLQQFYYPSTLGQLVQRSGYENLSEGETSIKPKSFQLISLRGSICDRCLTIDTIPIFLYKDGTVKEIHNHSCSEDRVSDLKRGDKHYLNKFFVILYKTLPKILAAKVMMCNKSQAKISFGFMKHDGFSSSNTEVYSIQSSNYPIRFFDAFPSEHQWINQIKNSQERMNFGKLETTEELLSFLEISMDSTMIMLKVKRDLSLSSSSENWDSYLVGLNLPDNNLEKVNTPFTPKFSN